MANCFPHGIDITAPGGIERLMDFHRLTFGNAVMRINPDVGNGEGSSDGEGDGDGGQQNGDKGQKPDGEGDKPLDEGGIRALKSERDARKAAEKRATEAESKLQAAEDAKLSDIDRANKKAADAEARATQLEAANARLAALAEHPVPKEYQDLVTGTDEASYLASAKKISELYAKAEGKNGKPDPVPNSGKGDRQGATGREAGLEQARKRGFIKD